MKIKETVWVILITVMMITAITPIAFAGLLPETIHVTFTPTGTIDLDLFPITAAFGDVAVSAADAYPTDYSGDTDYTVYNNGTAKSTVFIFTNTTTDNYEWRLKDSASPAEDQYTLDVTGTNSTYITGSNTSWLGVLEASATVTFGLNLDLGTSSGAGQLDAQATTINITAIIKT